MPDVFISYASENREHANKLATALGARGWSVWWDRKIVTGESFDRAIERELDASKSVVVLWSRASISSEWVKNEAAAAAERGVLVPAFIEDVRLPLEFRRKQTANLIKWDGNPSHGGFQSVCDSIALLIGGSMPRQQAFTVAVGRRWNPIWTIGAVAAIAIAGVLAAYSLGFGPTSPARPVSTTSVEPTPEVTARLQPKLHPEPPATSAVNSKPLAAIQKARVRDPDGFVNVRKGPGTGFAIIGRVNSGETVELRELKGSWWVINAPIDGGHIHQSRLVPSE